MFIHDGTTTPLAPTQDPNNQDTWGGDWTEHLLPGETISKSRWLVPTNLLSMDEFATLTHTVIKLKGGIVGKSYLLTNRIKTNLGNIIDRSMFIRCVEL